MMAYAIINRKVEYIEVENKKITCFNLHVIKFVQENKFWINARICLKYW